MAKGQELPVASVPIGDTGRLMALNEYNGKSSVVIGRVYKGTFYIDFVTKELNDGRTFNIPQGVGGYDSKEELADALVSLAALINGESTPDDGTSDPQDDIPF